MKLKCTHCSHEFEGNSGYAPTGWLSFDGTNWHRECPKCGKDFPVKMPEGKYVLAFATKAEGENPYANFTEDMKKASLVSYYAFNTRKEFLQMWEEKVCDENPDGMWYWAFDADGECITNGGPNPEDIELLLDAWGIEADESGDIAEMLRMAYASCDA